jgi:hypothetical protein
LAIFNVGFEITGYFFCAPYSPSGPSGTRNPRATFWRPWSRAQAAVKLASAVGEGFCTTGTAIEFSPRSTEPFLPHLLPHDARVRARVLV